MCTQFVYESILFNTGTCPATFSPCVPSLVRNVKLKGSCNAIGAHTDSFLMACTSTGAKI